MYNLKYVSKKNIERIQRDVSKDYFRDKKLSVLEYPNAVVASRLAGGPGVFSTEGYVKESDWNNCVTETRQLKSDSVQYVDEEVVFVGTLNNVYGHMITDNLKHLWILLNDNRFRKLKFVCTRYDDDNDVSSIFFTICKLLGKPQDEIVQVLGAKKYRKVYIPEQCFFSEPNREYKRFGTRCYTKEYKQIIEKIKSGIPANGEPENIYFSRTALHGERFRDFGEQSIENTFRNLGYKIVFPESMNFYEQVAMLKNCKNFAATQGSISLNSVFCDDTTTVILIDKQNYSDPYQLAINQTRNGNCIVIDANCSVLNPRKEPWIGPFFMYNSKELSQFAGITYKGFPWAELIKYCFWGTLKRAKMMLNVLM